VHLGHESSTHYFSGLGGPGAFFIKKHTGTRYAELVFLHLVGFAGHLVLFGALGTRIVDTLFFMLR
jgi:hypothetical protein